MKINKLTMFGFGPYASEIQLDFNKLNEEGLFLITGNTGAGKTTIFDGITYALYDETNSGSSEKNKEIICDFLNIEEYEKVFVELDFEIGINSYKIRRTPKYNYITRLKTIGEKESSVELYENGKISKITKKTDLNNYIKSEIIKLDKSQFSKIMMLAQGSFNEFIKADSSAKATILTKILGTDFYKEFENKLKEEKSSLNITIEKERNSILAQISTAQVENSENWRTDIIDFETQINILKSQYEEYTNLINDEINLKKNFNLEEIINKIQEAKTINSGITNYKNAILNLNALENEKNTIDEKREKVLVYDKALDIKSEITTLDNLILKLNEQNSNFNNLTVESDSFKASKLDFLNKEILYKTQLETAIKDVAKINLFKNDRIEYLEKEKISNKLTKDISLCEKLQKENLEQLEELILKLDNLNKNSILFNEQLEKKHSLQSSINELKLKKSEIDPAITLFKSIDSIKLKKENLEKELLSSRELKNLKHEIYNKLNSDFLKNEAYLISQHLKENEPCPVCGSILHPNIVEKPLNSPSIDEIKNAEASYNKAISDFSNIEGIYTETCNTIKESTNNLMVLCKNINLSFDFQEILLTEASLSKNITELTKEISILPSEEEGKTIKELIEKSNFEYEKLKDKKYSYEKELIEFSSSMENIEKRMKQIIENFTNNSLEISNFEDEEAILKNKELELKNILQLIENDKKTIENFSTRLKESEKTILNLNNEILEKDSVVKNLLVEKEFIERKNYELALTYDKKTLLSEIKNYEDAQIKFKTIISENEKYKDNIEIDINALEKNKDFINEELKKIDDKINALLISQNSIKKPLEYLEKSRPTFESKNKEYEMVSKLLDITLGNHSNQNKISFDKYILRIYFQEIINMANLRFKEMTNGQFHICIAEETTKDKRSALGLELNVFDAHTGKERSIMTLSGGETFKASMALALGLSDVVQSKNGNIALDSVFIDEGFGTLDDESLSSAMDILMDIKNSGRTVGIISHVNELKQSITTQILVEKAEKGSKAYIKY